MTSFRFKQFTIRQDRCAMKVGTDGVLLGTWVNPTGARRILDIGTGTGLIALMLAQRTTNQLAQIDGLEIEPAAVQQACENLSASPWTERVTIHKGAVQSFTPSQKYDLIVTNPPFFDTGGQARTVARTTARHTSQLSLVDLWSAAKRLLTTNGRLAVIYPVEIGTRFLELGSQIGFHCLRRCEVKPTPTKQVKRLLLEVGRYGDAQPSEQLTIELSRHVYTPEFIDRIKNFYLKY